MSTVGKKIKNALQEILLKDVWKVRISFFALCLCFAVIRVQATPVTLTANFDNLTEGSQGIIFSDDGITFQNLNQYIIGPYSPNFVIESTTAALPGFSPPNYLTFTGYVPGIGYSFGRFGSANIGFSGTGLSANMNVFGFGDSSMNTLTLEGLWQGNVVTSDTITFYGNPSEVVERQLSISGTFDSLELVSAGAENGGADFFGIDNVSITVPDSLGNGFVCYALAGISLGLFGRWQKAKSKYAASLYPVPAKSGEEQFG